MSSTRYPLTFGRNFPGHHAPDRRLRARLTRSSLTPGVLAAAVAVVAAGCAAPSAVSGPGAPDAGVATSAETSPSPVASHPLTLDNCGVEVTVDSPPQRVVTIKSSTTELMLALGLADRIVGSAFLDGPIPQEYGPDPVTVLSDKVPGFEAVLSLEPDLVYAGWESNFSVEGAGEREQLTDLGIDTYVSPAACKEAGYKPDPLTFDTVFAEIEQAGELFGVPEAAARIVADQRAQLTAIEPHDGGLTAAWYSSGEDVPYMGAGIGAPQMIMDAVGLENIAAEVRDTWTSMGWEQVVADDPDVIVLVDSAWNTAQHKIDMLQANPATSQLTAVREERYLILPFPATEAGVRNVAAVQDLAAQLEDLGSIP